MPRRGECPKFVETRPHPSVDGERSDAERRRVFLWHLGPLCLALFFPWSAAFCLAAEPPSDDSQTLTSPLRAFLARQRSVERDVGHLEREIQAHRIADAVRAAQTLLDRDEDGFLWLPGEKIPRSARQHAERLIASLGADGLQTYRDFTDAEAASLLKESDQANDPTVCGEILRRFFLSTSASDAVDRLATRATLHGEPAAAVRLWRKLVDEPFHAERLQTVQWRKIHAAALSAGDVDLAERAYDALSARKAAPRLVPPQTGPPAVNASLVEWLMPLGNARHSALSDVSVPWLRPVWTAEWHGFHERQHSSTVAPNATERDEADPFNSQQLEEVRKARKSWSDGRLTTLQSPASSPQAVVVSDQVVFRDAEGIRAVSLTSGTTVWSYRSAASLLRPASDELRAPGGGIGPVDFAAAHAENSVLGLLSSDGAHVFAVEAVDLRSPRPAQRGLNGTDADGAVAKSRAWNRLVALPVSTESSGVARRPDWSVGGPGVGGNRDPLKGAFFFGPPLPSDGRLFAVIENDRQLSAVSLRARDGELIWRQSLGYVDRPVDHDDFRSLQACLPILVDGVLVCPTNSGFLIALDPETGTLLWGAVSGADRFENRFAFGVAPRVPTGSRAFPNVLLGARGRVLSMPHHAQQIVCHDIQTGATLWSATRIDGEYLAATTDTHAIVVGRRMVRSLKLDDGVVAWSSPVGMPCGTGVRAGRRFLLPLKSGTVASIDLESGRTVGIAFPVQPAVDESDVAERPAPPYLGNLVPSGEFVLSCEPTRITAFRAAGTLVEEVVTSLESRPDDLSLKFLLAQLHLTLGKVDPARVGLRTVANSAESPALREQARHILRDVLFLDLESPSADSTSLLAELDRLCDDPSSRSHYLMTRAELQARTKDFAGALRTAHEFATLRGADEPQPISGNAQHFIAPGRWVPAFLSRLHTQWNDDDRTRLQRQVEVDRDAALARGDVASLEAFLDVYGGLEDADAVRLRLAAVLSDAGRVQQSELTLLECRRSPDRRTQATAIAGLAELWERQGLYHESARLLVELDESYAAEREAVAGPLRAWLDSLGSDSPVDTLKAEFASTRWPVTRVRIDEDRLAAIDSRLEESFGPYRRKLATPADSGLFLLDRGAQTSAEGNRISIIDRHTGAATGELVVPRSIQLGGPPPRLTLVGHFFPYGVDGQACGTSLTEIDDEGPLWTTPLKRLPIPGDVRPGPTGPGFASFVARQYLAVLDPRTGRVLWERSDVDALGSQPEIVGNLFGDEHALVLFAADRSAFIAFRTDTGEEIRRGKSEDLGILRTAFGRKLLFAPDGDSEKTLRLWDPVTGQVDWSAAVDERVLTIATPDEKLVIAGSNLVALVDPKSGKTLTSCRVENLDLLNLASIRAFTDRDTLYVNLQRDLRLPATANNSTQADTLLPVTVVTGDFYAIDRVTGKVRWKRTLPTRSIVDLPHHHLPFLITLSQIRDRLNGTRQSLLIEIIDKRTGETLGLHDNLIPSRVVLLACDPAEGRIELTGLRTVIRLHFEKALQRRLKAFDGLTTPGRRRTAAQGLSRES